MSIDARGITKTFGDFHALRDVTVSIERGKLTALLGPSGGGKSTLLRIIAGLEKPDAGRVYIDGKDMTGVPARRRGVGFVFQHYAAFPHMTVWDNVAFGLKIAKTDKQTTKARVGELLDLVHLAGPSPPLPERAARRSGPANGAPPRSRRPAEPVAPGRAVRRARRQGATGA